MPGARNWPGGSSGSCLTCRSPASRWWTARGGGGDAVTPSCADMRMGSPRASFTLPEVAVGRCGGGRHLMRHLPQGVVRRMYLTGQPLPSEDALRYGFLDSVH